MTPPLGLRTPATGTGALESAVVAAAAVAAPLGWPLGRALYAWVAALIPERLRAYPIAALIWTAVVCDAPLPLLYDPQAGLWSTLITPRWPRRWPATRWASLTRRRQGTGPRSVRPAQTVCRRSAPNQSGDTARG